MNKKAATAKRRSSESLKTTLTIQLQQLKRTNKNVTELPFQAFASVNFVLPFPFSSIRLMQHVHYQSDK